MSHLIPRAPSAQAIHALGEDLAAINREKRRRRSLQTCHRPALQPPMPAYRSRSEAYVPQFSARLLNDPRLSDGARRCAAKLMELAYRRNRAGRSFEGTVVYLAKCLGRSERAVQHYLAQLRAGGYIQHQVITSRRARMCIGILVTLLRPCFPAHHAASWPEDAISSAKSGVNRFSENYRTISKRREQGAILDADQWATNCMNGVFRALMATTPLTSACQSGQ